jgi:hypothetical protein
MHKTRHRPTVSVTELPAAHNTVHRLRLYQNLLDAIATHRVANRPDRLEPRVKERQLNHYGWLTRPRTEIKRDMAKGVIKIQVQFVASTKLSKRIVPDGLCRPTGAANGSRLGWCHVPSGLLKKSSFR